MWPAPGDAGDARHDFPVALSTAVDPAGPRRRDVLHRPGSAAAAVCGPLHAGLAPRLGRAPAPDLVEAACSGRADAPDAGRPRDQPGPADRDPADPPGTSDDRP